MSQLDIDWSAAPEWAQWAAQDADGSVWVHSRRPALGTAAWICPPGASAAWYANATIASYWRDTLTQRPQTVVIHQDNDGAGMLRAQIGHLLEDMTSEQLDALYAHVCKQLDAAKFDELNRHLDRPFGEVPREWQLKAFEAFLDGYDVLNLHPSGSHYTGGAYPTWAAGERYRVEQKQS